MRIADAQIHVWGSGLPSNMAHRQVTSFTTEEAVGLMDEGGVDAAVIHPAGWDPNSTEMAFKAVRDFPGRFAILGAFPLSSPDRRALVETRPARMFWGTDITKMPCLAAVRDNVHRGATLVAGA